MKEKANYVFNKCLVLFTALFLFYYSYRYLFKYNSETTSPTYQNTPTLFKLLKYVLLAIVILMLLMSVVFKKVKIKLDAIMCVLILLNLNMFFVVCICHSINSIIFLIFLMIVTIFYIFGTNISLVEIKKVLDIYLYFAIVYELIQLVLYYSVGRLPALAYPTGNLTDVRFGGPIDDPNGFGILLSFFISYVFYEFKGKKRIAFVSILLLFLILTWSLTAIGTLITLFLGLLLYKFFKKNRLNKKTVLSIISVAIVFIAGVIICTQSTFFSEFIKSKSKSISQHLNSLDQLKSIDLATFSGVKPQEIIVESGAVRIINYGGIIFTVLFYTLCAFGVKNAIYLVKNSAQYNSLYKGCVFYILAFVIASINLPMIYSFVCFGFLVIVLSICFVNARYLRQLKISERLQKEQEPNVEE